MKKAVFFAPHAGIWFYSFPEAIVAESLKHEGYDIVYVGCDEVFKSYCASMSAVGLTATSSEEAKAKVCAECRTNHQLIQQGFRFPSELIGQYLTSADYKAVDQLLANLDWNNIVDTNMNGIPIGSWALYEPCLTFKKINFTFTEPEKPTVIAAIKNSALSYLASKKIMEKHNPDLVVVYNSHYGANKPIVWLAEKANVKAVSVHGGHNLARTFQTMTPATTDGVRWVKEAKDNWPVMAQLPIGKAAVKNVMKHFEVLLGSKSVFVYSDKISNDDRTVRQRLNIPAHQKLVVATLSSYDERFAAQKSFI